jgi:hypothetical protein
MKKDFEYWADMKKAEKRGFEAGCEYSAMRSKAYMKSKGKNMNEWKRLTRERFDKLGVLGDRVSDIFRNYELEYLVLPEGEWTTVRNFDNKIQSNVYRYDPKVVYRFRPKDKADIAWQKYQSEMGKFCGKEYEFKAGYKAGFSDGKEL